MITLLSLDHNTKNNKSGNYQNIIRIDLDRDEPAKVKKIENKRVKRKLEFGSEELLVNCEVPLESINHSVSSIR